jgi:hypothetical protein
LTSLDALLREIDAATPAAAALYDYQTRTSWSFAGRRDLDRHARRAEVSSCLSVFVPFVLFVPARSANRRITSAVQQT